MEKKLKKDKTYGRESINLLLNLFDKYNISATWAIVGHLFLNECHSVNGKPHSDMPWFTKNWFYCDPCTDIYTDPLYYGSDIVKNIISRKSNHEIGYHSFSHVDFSKCNMKVADAEIKKGLDLAKELNIKLKSFVFPNNKIGNIDVLRENGFKIYRGRTNLRAEVSRNRIEFVKNAFKDKIKASPVVPKLVDNLIELPASMFFGDPVFKFTALLRAKYGIDDAIKTKNIFHVYFHPHNVMMYASYLKDFESLLKYVSHRVKKRQIEVMTMGELSELSGY